MWDDRSIQPQGPLYNVGNRRERGGYEEISKFQRGDFIIQQFRERRGGES